MNLNYVKGGSATITGTTSISVAANTPNTNFQIDVGTLPLWLTATPTSGTASSGGVPITFTIVNTIAAGMATGNYTANVGFFAAGYSDVLVPIAFSISNTAPTVALKKAPRKSMASGRLAPTCRLRP